ncbi:MAG: 50S ribosomal protein L10 [Endomicrobium sp.]|jgi:large subunit ribosomal protein L10|nr:50S ribosomal protein L10 [Endomicrobium sp.]
MPNIKNQETVENLTEKFKNMKGMILTQYHGLTVEEISELRSRLRSVDSEYTVVKNTLSEIALKKVGIETGNNFSGPTALVIENNDIISPAKVLMDFMKIHTKLRVKTAYLEGKFVDADVVEQFSKLPSRDILIAKLLGSMNVPLNGFVNVLVATIRGLVTVLDAIAKKQAV